MLDPMQTAANNQDDFKGIVADADLTGLLTTAELAKALDCSSNAVRQWSSAGLQPNKIGKTVANRPKFYYRLEDVRTWLAANGNFARLLASNAGSTTSTDTAEPVKRSKITKRDYEAAGFDFEAVLRRARIVEKKSFDNYSRKLEQGNAVESLAAQKQYLDSVEQLKKLEQTAPEILQAQGKLVEASEVEREIAELGLMIKNDLLALPSKIAPRLVGKTEIEIEQDIKQEIEQALRHIGGEHE